jgi:D-alanyl-D-alanine carboxypeptidase/D-alanyl-D-alanine-endopeptidase (penicillin-binding protein 4)
MGPGQFVRSWGLAIVLGLTSLGSWQAAERGDTDVVSVEPVANEHSLSTPMLSARRIPRTIQAPVVDDRIRPGLVAIITGSPPASCLLVQVGGRVLEPRANTAVPLVPASNQKLLTTYAALLRLGPNFRYRTRVAADAAPDEAGVVNGNLYFIGDGDPFLSTDEWWSQYEDNEGRHHTRLETLADQIVAAGIVGVTGSVVGDESLFDAERQSREWPERLVESKQSGPLSALTVNEGFVAWQEVFTDSRQRSETDNPPLQAASLLAELLAERGVAIGAAAPAPAAAGVTPSGVAEITAIESPPLIEVLTHINSHSSNLGAELLLKKLGAVDKGAGTAQAGAEAVREILAADGVPTAGLNIVDGSGLAETNLVTCETLASILANAGADSDFAATLAIGAERGSLSGRFVDSPVAGLVYAKTGTLNDATALSGYVQSSIDPEVDVIFAYIANEELVIADDAVRSLQDPFVVALAGYPGDPAIDTLSPLAPAPG